MYKKSGKGISKNTWKDARTDPPKKNGKYLVCKRSLGSNSHQIIDTAYYAADLYKADIWAFEKELEGKSGWFEESKFVIYDVITDEVDYWRELPSPPIVARR